MYLLHGMGRAIEILCVDILYRKRADRFRLAPRKSPVVRPSRYEQAVLLCNVQIVPHILLIIARIKNLKTLEPLLNECIDQLLIAGFLGIREYGNPPAARMSWIISSEESRRCGTYAGRPRRSS